MKRYFFRPYLVVFSALIFTFLFFIFSEYYRPIFAIRIFFVDVSGLLVITFIYFKIQPFFKSLIKRCLLIVFSYFTLYDLIDHLIVFSKHHRFLKGSLTDLIEIETAVITFLLTFFISGMVSLTEPKESLKE